MSCRATTLPTTAEWFLWMRPAPLDTLRVAHDMWNCQGLGFVEQPVRSKWSKSLKTSPVLPPCLSQKKMLGIWNPKSSSHQATPNRDCKEPHVNALVKLCRWLGFKSLNRFILGMFVPGRVVMNIQKIFFSEESCLSRARRFKIILTTILYRDFLVSSPSSLINLIVYFLLGPATRVLCQLGTCITEWYQMSCHDETHEVDILYIYIYIYAVYSFM